MDKGEKKTSKCSLSFFPVWQSARINAVFYSQSSVVISFFFFAWWHDVNVDEAGKKTHVPRIFLIFVALAGGPTIPCWNGAFLLACQQIPVFFCARALFCFIAFPCLCLWQPGAPVEKAKKEKESKTCGLFSLLREPFGSGTAQWAISKYFKKTVAHVADQKHAFLFLLTCRSVLFDAVPMGQSLGAGRMFQNVWPVGQAAAIDLAGVAFSIMDHFFLNKFSSHFGWEGRWVCVFIAIRENSVDGFDFAPVAELAWLCGV